jgi:hypothetical protein
MFKDGLVQKTLQFKIFLRPSARGCGKNLPFLSKNSPFQTVFGRFGHVFHKIIFKKMLKTSMRGL